MSSTCTTAGSRNTPIWLFARAPDGEVSPVDPGAGLLPRGPGAPNYKASTGVYPRRSALWRFSTTRIFCPVPAWTRINRPPRGRSSSTRALKTTKRDSNGQLEVAGFAWGPDGQGHQRWREALNRQNGLIPMTPDLKKITWTDPKGVEAFTWWTDLVTKGKVAEADFYTEDRKSVV